IRDVAEDYERGRIYLPREDLERFGCDFSDLGKGYRPTEFKNLMDFEANRAREYFESGKKLFPYLSIRVRACPAGLYGVYSNLLTEMENSEWDVWEKRASLPTLKKINAVFGQWFTALRS
ncbi:MAG: phytoene/squalene synthase family protein, partial [Candidatus Bipolaricaulota bacterium]